MTEPATYTPEYRGTPSCLVCGVALSVRFAQGRKSRKPFVMLVCPADGRHFRAFVNDRAYVREVLLRLEERQQQGTP